MGDTPPPLLNETQNENERMITTFLITSILLLQGLSLLHAESPIQEKQQSLSSLLEELGDETDDTTKNQKAEALKPELNMNSVIKAAQAGDLSAQNALGIAYAQGSHGMETNGFKALQWLSTAANRGSVKAKYNLWVICDQGTVDVDTSIGIIWLYKAARHGLPEAQYRFGIATLGVGFDSADDLEDLNFVSKAAAQGLPEAQVIIAELLLYEDPVFQKDPAKGLEMAKQAAEEGLAEAQALLANLYREGIGVPKDLATAKVWYRKAAYQGLPEAKLALSKLSLQEFLELHNRTIRDEQKEFSSFAQAYAWGKAAVKDNVQGSKELEVVILEMMSQAIPPALIKEIKSKAEAVLKDIPSPAPDQIQFLF